MPTEYWKDRGYKDWIQSKVNGVVEASVTCILVLRNVAVRTSLKIYDSKVLIKLKKY